MRGSEARERGEGARRGSKARERGRGHLAAAVAHPPRALELAHVGVDERVASPTLCPRLEARRGARPGVFEPRRLPLRPPEEKQLPAVPSRGVCR